MCLFAVEAPNANLKSIKSLNPVVAVYVYGKTKTKQFLLQMQKKIKIKKKHKVQKRFNRVLCSQFVFSVACASMCLFK